MISERSFLLYIAILILFLIIGTLFKINARWIIGGLSFIFGMVSHKYWILLKRSVEKDTSVISQIIKDK